jgi:hypothetical protein
LRIATRCASLDQFVAAFNRFCDAQTCFISTLTMRPVGLETAFSIDLATGAPALRGLGVVLEAWGTPGNRFGRPGLLLGIRKLAGDSERVFERLLAAHVAATPPPPPAAPSSIAAPLALPTVVPDGERTPGSELVLPANPLMNISDHSLEGFVDCTLYEETGNFFPAPEPDAEQAPEPAIDPPILAPRRVTIPPMESRTATGPMTPIAMPFEPRTVTGPMMPIAMPPPVPMPAMAMPMPMPTPFPMVVTPPPIPMPLTRPTIRRDEVAPQAPELPVPPRAELALQPRRAISVAWPRRRIAVAGGVAVATIAIAIVVAAGSGHAHVAETTATPQLMAANSPAPTRATAPQPAVPTTTAADVVPSNAPDDPGDTGGAPTFGAGPCKIAVSTTPAGSIVSIDGEIAGPSPITIGGPCGKRKLDIAHPRYAPATRVVTATPAAAAIDVALARPTHDLYVETSPPGAIVSIDGHRAGTSPTLVKVMGFTTLTLRIEKFGFTPRTQKIYSKSPRDHVAVRLGH